MKRPVKLLRKVLALIVGLPLLALGIVLIPIPGPGLLICFIALFILSLGFDGMKPYVDRIIAEFKKIYEKAKERQRKIEEWGDKDKSKPES